MVALILRDLAFGPATIRELEAVTGIHRRNLRHYLALLHEQKRVRICGWEQRTGPALPIWAIGDAKDKPRPARKYVRRGQQP